MRRVPPAASPSEVQCYAAAVRVAALVGKASVDETYVKVKGRWTYLYRAVDGRGQTIDFLLSARRDTAAVKRFFRKALGQPHMVNRAPSRWTRTWNKTIGA